MLRVSLVLFSLLFAAGCVDPLAPGTFIEDPRVLGARVAVDGDETRASPAPGESATATFYVATPPGDASTFGWAFVPCAKSSANLSVPVCEGQPSLADLSMGTGPVPVARLTVPSLDALGGATKMLILGVVCANGTPTIDGSNGTPGCSSSTTKTQAVYLDVDIALDAASTNENPDASAVATTFGGEAWTATSEASAATGCRDAGTLPIATEDEEYELTIDLSSVEREPYARTTPGDPPLVEEVLEELQLSHFSTVDGMERQFSIIDANSTSTVAKVSWTAHNAEFDETGTRVDFYFVVRDDRGGSDWFTRSVCAVPKPASE